MDGYIRARCGTYTDVTRSRNGTEKTGQNLAEFARGRKYSLRGSTKTEPQKEKEEALTRKA